MNILITGGRGFIGSHLCEELETHGHTVTVADWRNKNGVKWPELDLGLPEVFSNVLNIVEEEIGRPDAVIHLAAQVGRLFGDKDISHTISSNAIMTALVAQQCGQRGIKLVYASTSEIYGDQAHVVCDEENGPFGLPHNIYGLSKRWGEEVCWLYAPKDLVILRPSMPYGPGVPPGRGRAALPNILWQAHTGQKIPIHRGAERSWCWIGDTVRAIRLILESRATGPFNVGRDDDSHLLRDLAELACEMVGQPKSLIEDVNPPPNQTIVKRLSTERIRKLNWTPEVEIEAGMERTLQWVRMFNAKGEKAYA